MTYNGKYDNAGAILEECREVGCALNQLDEQINNLKRVFIQVLARPDMPSKEMNSLSSQIMTSYRDLVSRVNQIKSNPESGSPRNAPQVGMVDRRLKVTIQRYQMLEADFRRDSQRAAERQYRIVRPDTKDAKVREAVSGPKAPVFEQALLGSGRRGQASSTLRNMKEHREAIQNIESQMVELAQLFKDLSEFVQQQEPLIADIEEKGEEITENVTSGNKEIGTAIVSARSRNHKKWWCLLICIVIAVIIAIVVTVVVVMINNKKP